MSTSFLVWVLIGVMAVALLWWLELNLPS